MVEHKTDERQSPREARLLSQPRPLDWHGTLGSERYVYFHMLADYMLTVQLGGGSVVSNGESTWRGRSVGEIVSFGLHI
jgi:hypothetical protein